MARELKPTEWVHVLLRRFRHQLPSEQSQKHQGQETYKLVQQSLVKLAAGRFTEVVTTLATYIRDLNYMQSLSPENQELSAHSNVIILETLEQCVKENPDGNAGLSDDVVQRQLLPVLCPLIIQPENIVLSKQMYTLGGKVLFLISVFHFHVIFRRVLLRMNRVIDTGEDLSSVSAVDEIELLKHLHVNRESLITVLEECSRYFKALRKYSQLALIKALNKVIWNWIEQYPEQFSGLYKEEYYHLSDASDKLFALLDNYSDSSKKKLASWPLQCMLILLCPNSVREASGSGTVSRAQNHMKRQFIENLKKGLSGSKTLIESSVLGCVQLCKASTYIDREENVVSFLVALVLNELKSLLYNQQKPFHPSSINVPVEELMTDCFVASFRINYRNNQHFEICFSCESNPIFQLALVIGLHRIINETPLRWWPKIEVMYPKAYQLRTMFQAVIRRVTMNENALIRGGQGRSSITKIRGEKKKDEEHVSVQKDVNLLLWLVKLFHADPMLALHNPGKAGHEIQASSMMFMNGLVAVMLSNAVGDVASEAAETLLCLHSVEHIRLWNPEAPIATFWEISSIIIFHVADCILQERVPNQLKMMRWLEEILKCRIAFLSANKDQATIGTHIPICWESLTKLEIIFLSSLWSSEQERILLAMTCFGLLNEEACLLNGNDNCNIIHPAPLQSVYHKLAHEVNRVKTGRTALQKRIMSILREVYFPTQGNAQAWDLTYTKWQRLTEALTYFPREEFPPLDVHRNTQSSMSSRKSVAAQPGTMITEMMETYLLEWTNMTGFLCSLGGICVQQEIKKDEEFTRKKMSQTSLKHLINCNVLSDAPVDRFIKELLSLLICSNEHTSLQIRNGVKESLAVDLSPALYPSFFFICRATMELFFTDNGQVKISEPHTTYIEQLIYILRSILDNKSEEVANALTNLAIEDIVLCIIKYIRNLPINVQSLVIKAKLCQLAESIMSRHSDLSFRQEMKFRNKLVEYLTEWVLSASDRINNVSAEVLAISCTLDEAAMKAIVVLLKSLPLQPETVESDIMEAKSQLFLKHFTLFMNILNKCYEASEDKDLTSRGSTLAPHYASLRTNTVQAMSNMLSANIDSGLMHSISLGYHEDPQTRSTFMEVLTDILKQGTEFDNLAETVMADRFERLVGLVTLTAENEDLPIAIALASVVPSEQMDELAQVLISIFDAKGMLYDLLWNLFRQEVLHAEGIQTVFRGNSLASKAMTYAFKIHGSGYLHTLLEPLITAMMENKNRSYEVDPMRIDQREDIVENRMYLTALADAFVERITASKESMPRQLRSLCFCLSKAVRERFPSNTFDAVSSAIFLRFINPAIVSPHALGIINQLPPDKVRRGLMLLSKILQNLANHLLFTKEPHMDVFNEFLENNFIKIERYFGELSSEPPSREKADSGFSFISDQNVYALHRLLWYNQEKIGSHLAIIRDYKSKGKGPFERMATLLAHLGPPDHQPAKMHKPWLRTSSYGSKFEQFMAKHADHNQDDMQALKSLQVFYQDGKSKTGHSVFYYIARRYKSDQVNDELLIYHILLTLQSAYGQQWDVVIDFSHTSPENMIKPDSLGRAFSVLPGNQVQSLCSVYLFNINNAVRQYAKVNERMLSGLKAKGNVVPVDNFNKFHEYIEPNQLKLPGTTVSLEDDIKTFCVQTSNRGNILVKVGPNSVQLQTIEKTKILGYPCFINDVFYANEIEKVIFMEDRLELQFSTFVSSVKFTSSQAEEVAGAVTHVMNRWKLSHATSETITPNKKIRPKDVPGTLLNMAVLNLGSRDPSLRLAAYNLLCALTSTFSLHIEERLLEANGLCIPANNTMFIKSLSEQLARREPGMTLEFLDECIGGFSKSDYELKHLCLEYMAPWLPNLTRFCNTAHDDPVRIKLNHIFEKLIQLTIQERQLYPSIQAKVWGNIGKVSELLDVVLDSFIKTSATGGLGSTKAEVMADTAVALAAANVPLVSGKIIGRLHTVIGRTSVSPTVRLEQHLMWDDIAILARYLLMLSFNDCLNVSHHLPDICHVTSLLLATGPLSLRASIHGLVINSVQSLLTCSGINFTDDTRRLLRTRLEDLSMQKFYLLFGISKVKSAPVKAFKASKRARNRTLSRDAEEDQISMSSVETVVETMLEIIETCAQDIPKNNWLRRWYDLASGFAFQHNPAIQPRAIIVLGCISREVDDATIRSLFQVLLQAVGLHHDDIMIEAVVMCLAKMQPLLPKESKYHKALFWVAVGILQLAQQSLYPSGLSLLEQNLSTLDSHGLFQGKGVAEVLIDVRKDQLLDWICKQMDHIVGLSFSTNFHFALCALILKGLRHPYAKTKSSAVRLLNLMLNICSKQRRRKDKFAVNSDTVAYLAALLPQSEDVRLRLQAEARAQSLRTSSVLSHHSKSGSVISQAADEELHVSILITPSSISDETEAFVWPAECHNLLLDPGVLSDTQTKALLFVLLAALVEYTTDDAESRILYEVLAEASIAFPDIFCITFPIINRKLSSVLSHSEDPVTLSAVQTIVESTATYSSDKPGMKLQYLSACGFFGLHTFPGPFIEAADPALAPHMFSRLVEAFLDKYTPTSMLPEARSNSVQLFKPAMSVDDNALLSSSLSHIPATDSKKTFKRVGSLSPAKLSSNRRTDRKNQKVEFDI